MGFVQLVNSVASSHSNSRRGIWSQYRCWIRWPMASPETSSQARPYMNWPQYVDEIVLVEESEITQAMTWYIEQHRLIVEGSGAVVLAALLNQRIAGISGKTVAAVLTGAQCLHRTLESAALKCAESRTC
jgi:threonine dehydratase